MEKPTSIHSGTPNPYVKQVPVIKFGNEHQYRKKNATLYYVSSFIKETINMRK